MHLFAAVFLFLSQLLSLSIGASETSSLSQKKIPWWEYQVIDTMKYSRDASRELLSKPAEADALIEQQLSLIAQTGATHVGIATPYDEEFLPILKKWVGVSRKLGLKVWFRGNWSGWEGWFDYKKISRQEHLTKTELFILTHPDLFEDGDIFSACPECENGGPGDPRLNNGAADHKQFLIEQYQVSTQAFKKINKNVRAGFHSMNGDVARLVMDPETTDKSGNTITIDHYVKTPQQLEKDLRDYAKQSKGQVFLGEMGAPIPDIHGPLTPDEQAKWLEDALTRIMSIPDVIGLNYWVGFGGSTHLWNDDGSPRPAVAALTKFFKPKVLSRVVKNSAGSQLDSVTVTSVHKITQTNKNGEFDLPYATTSGNLIFSKKGYLDAVLPLNQLISNQNPIVLVREPRRFGWLLDWIEKLGLQFRSP